MVGNKVLPHISLVNSDFMAQQTLTLAVRQADEFIFEVPGEVAGLQVALAMGSIPRLLPAYTTLKGPDRVPEEMDACQLVQS